MSANLSAIRAGNGNNYVKSVSSQQDFRGIILTKKWRLRCHRKRLHL